MEHFVEKWMSIYSWRSFDNLIVTLKQLSQSFLTSRLGMFIYLVGCEKRPLNSTYHIICIILCISQKKSKLKCNGFRVSNRNVCIIHSANIWHFKRNSQLHGICSVHKSFRNRYIQFRISKKAAKNDKNLPFDLKFTNWKPNKMGDFAKMLWPS